MIITFTDVEGKFFAFNLNRLEGISCYRQCITIFPIDNPCVIECAVPREEVEKVEKQLKKFAKKT